MPSGFLSSGIMAAGLMVTGGGVIALTGGIGAVALRLIHQEGTAAEETAARLRLYGVGIMGTGIILWIILYILLTFS